MVEGDDNKVRYIKPLRLEMYQHLYADLKRHNADTSLIYFCMERSDIWRRIFGYVPESIGHLDYLFADSLYTRFPYLNMTKPKKALYELFQDT